MDGGGKQHASELSWRTTTCRQPWLGKMDFSFLLPQDAAGHSRLVTPLFSQGAGEQASSARGPGLPGLWGVSEHRGACGPAAEHSNSKCLCQQAEVLL